MYKDNGLQVHSGNHWKTFQQGIDILDCIPYQSKQEDLDQDTNSGKSSYILVHIRCTSYHKDISELEIVWNLINMLSI